MASPFEIRPGFDTPYNSLNYQQMNTNNTKHSPIVLGVSEVGELVSQQFLIDHLNHEVSLRSSRSSWSIPRLSVGEEWMYETFKGCRQLGYRPRTNIIWYNEHCLINVYFSAAMMTFVVLGSEEDTNTINKLLDDSPFTNAESTVEWVHNEDGSSVEVPLRKRALIQSAYPWIKDESVDAYIDRFLASDESVLILIGPPGTGKTSFIRHMILRARASAQITYDERIMGSDSLFANWLDSSNQFIVLEDSDLFLKPRDDGNGMMHKFLNVSEGLITVAGKKMIFSTNLPKISDIDEALMRKGRCFDVLEFRALTPDESWNVLDEINSDRQIDESKTHTLAELFGPADGNDTQRTARKAGFGFC